MNYFNPTQQQNSFGLGDTPFSLFGSGFQPASFQPTSFMDTARSALSDAGSLTGKYNLGNSVGSGSEVSLMEKLFGGHNRMGYVPAAAQSLAGIGQAWAGLQNYKLAKKQFNFSKQAYQQNLANQIKSYNTQMEDRLRGRTSDYEGKEEDIQKEMEKRKLSE